MNEEEFFFWIELDTTVQKTIPDEDMRARALIASIIYQAFIDALDIRRGKDHRTALAFIDAKNKTFAYYCDLIDFDAEWLANRLRKLIEENKKNDRD